MLVFDKSLEKKSDKGKTKECVEVQSVVNKILLLAQKIESKYFNEIVLCGTVVEQFTEFMRKSFFNRN